MIETRPVCARHIYSEGDYDHALRCYFSAQDWAMGTGAVLKGGLHGVINRPHHDLCPASERFVPEDMIKLSGWNITVDFYCDPEALEWLKEQEVPELAKFVIAGEETL